MTEKITLSSIIIIVKDDGATNVPSYKQQNLRTKDFTQGERGIMKNKTLILLLALTVTMTSMTGCGNKETEAPAATEAVAEIETETETAELTVTALGTDLVFETGKPITVFDLLSDVSSTSEITVAFSDETALFDAQAEEAVEDTESTEMTEDTESTEDTEAVEETEAVETEEEPSFDSYDFSLEDMPVLCYTESGEYTNTITVTNAEGEVFIQEFHFTVADAPVITAEGGEINTGDEDGLAAFTCSASATDAVDGDLTASVTADASAVQLDTEGTYPVVFSVKNSFGIEASKTVEVTVTAAAEKKTEKNTASKTDTSDKKNNSTSGKSQTASSTAGNSSTASASGNNSNASSNSGNSSQTSGGNTSGDTGNTSTPSAPTTPSTDNGGSTPAAPSAPSTPAAEPTPAPSTPSADSGSSSGGEMEVPEGENIINGDDIVNPPIDQLGGSGEYTVENP